MPRIQSNELDDYFTLAAKAESFELGMKLLTRALGGTEPSPGMAHVLLNSMGEKDESNINTDKINTNINNTNEISKNN
jgi:hypothetical protein